MYLCMWTTNIGGKKLYLHNVIKNLKKNLCHLWGSNSRPSDYETDVLPTAPRRHLNNIALELYMQIYCFMHISQKLTSPDTCICTHVHVHMCICTLASIQQMSSQTLPTVRWLQPLLVPIAYSCMSLIHPGYIGQTLLIEGFHQVSIFTTEIHCLCMYVRGSPTLTISGPGCMYLKYTDFHSDTI